MPDRHRPDPRLRRIALVGAGRMGVRHARTITASTRATLVAVVDPRPADGTPPHLIASLGELSADRVDAVICAAPTHQHLDIGRTLAEAGLPALIEKPAGGTRETTTQLADAFARRAGHARVGYSERFNPCTALTARLVNEGALGEITHIHTRRIGPHPTTGHSPTRPSVTSDLMCHDIDLLRWMLGIDLTSGPRAAARPPDSNATETRCRVRTQAGDHPTRVDLLAAWSPHQRHRLLTLQGSRASLRVDLLHRSVHITERPATHPRTTRWVEVPTPSADSLAGQLDDFLTSIDGIRGRGASLDDARSVSQAIDTIASPRRLTPS